MMELSKYSYLDELEAINIVLGKSHKHTKPGDSFEKGKLRKRKYHIWLNVCLSRRIKSILNNEDYNHPNGNHYNDYFCLCCDEHVRTRFNSGEFKRYLVTHPDSFTEKEIEVANNYPTRDFYFFSDFKKMAENNSHIDFPISSKNICCNCFNRIHAYFNELEIFLGQTKNDMVALLEEQREHSRSKKREIKDVLLETQKKMAEIKLEKKQIKDENIKLKKQIENMTSKDEKIISGKKIEI